jgi:hypothetical protein
VLRPPSSVAHGAADVPHVNGPAADSSTSSCAASYAAAYAAADPSLMFEDDCGGIYSDPEYTEALVAVATIKQHGLRALDPEQAKRLVLKHVRECDNKGNKACPTCNKLRERIRQSRAQKQQVSALPCLPLLEDARYVPPQPRLPFYLASHPLSQNPPSPSTAPLETDEAPTETPSRREAEAPKRSMAEELQQRPPKKRTLQRPEEPTAGTEDGSASGRERRGA